MSVRRSSEAALSVRGYWMRQAAGMRYLLLLALTCAMPGCSSSSEPAPAAYVFGTDRLVAAFPILTMFRQVCERHGTRLPDQQCYRFGPQRRWSGLVVQSDYFANSFYPAGVAVTPAPPGRYRYAVVGVLPKRECASPLCSPLSHDVEPPELKTFYVEFLGRRTSVEGRYGHMGLFGHKIIVDRLLVSRAIPLPNLAKASGRRT